MLGINTPRVYVPVPGQTAGHARTHGHLGPGLLVPRSVTLCSSAPTFVKIFPTAPDLNLPGSLNTHPDIAPSSAISRHGPRD